MTRLVERVTLALSLVLVLYGQTSPSRTGSIRGSVFTTESGQERYWRGRAFQANLLLALSR